MDHVPTPDTLHCAPLGWPGIRQAMGRIAGWFASDDPALMICDVSAEIAQLSRICSVPHVKILQHGDRGDQGHQAAYSGAVGLLAPFSAALAQPDWQPFSDRIHYAPGLGIPAITPPPGRRPAGLGAGPDRPVALLVSGAGGTGFAQAPMGVAARAFPDWHWMTIGATQPDWHATQGGNLTHRGWVDDPATHVAAADLVISSTGNTTCAQVLAAGRPWIVVPEWRYFDEQRLKAEALARAGVALHLPHLPSSAHAGALRSHERWTVTTPRHRRASSPPIPRPTRPDGWKPWRATCGPPPPRHASRRSPCMIHVSALTIAAGREAHLRNVVAGFQAQQHKPSELIIGVMQDADYTDLPRTDFPIRQIRVTAPELPLSAARNAVADAATGDMLVFVDVDCIPAPDFISAIWTHGGPSRPVHGRGDVPAPRRHRRGLDFDRFADMAVKHSDRQGPRPPGWRPVPTTDASGR